MSQVPERRTGSLVGAIVAVVVLAGGSGLAALFSLFVFPMASDGCGDADSHLICTANGQMLVAVGPLLAAAAGTTVAACSCALRPGRRAVGIGIGYVIGFGGFLIASVIADAV
ncbi:hypothetical protein GCM10010435_66610 [Winogradskya consettensis]|uniref:Uncharacterized protein n=1 Tax=Winogradskya consettensis TaxID=113560 RepID=A0A919SL17_9ACTN|nr:hypothetical protein [Actinoplanes consettensis]GIM73985.1 hypothetical protein Aco04nite_38150 [Actinoplanes consettensis]